MAVMVAVSAACWLFRATVTQNDLILIQSKLPLLWGGGGGGGGGEQRKVAIPYLLAKITKIT